jgi:hypothetical protein
MELPSRPWPSAIADLPRERGGVYLPPGWEYLKWAT